MKKLFVTLAVAAFATLAFAQDAPKDATKKAPCPKAACKCDKAACKCKKDCAKKADCPKDMKDCKKDCKKAADAAPAKKG